MSDYQSKLRIEKASLNAVKERRQAIEELRKLIQNTGYPGMIPQYEEKIWEHEKEIIRLQRQQ